MLYVAIWYVSIRPVVMRVKEELQSNSSFNSPSSGAFLCCMLYVSIRYEGEGRTAVLPSPS